MSLNKKCMNKKIFFLTIISIIGISLFAGAKFSLASNSSDETSSSDKVKPMIKILSPNGGEKWINDKENKVEFKTRGISPSSYLTLRLRRVDGESVTPGNEDGAPQTTQVINSGVAIITPDSDFSVDGSYKIEIEAYIENVQYIDYSDMPFTVVSAAKQSIKNIDTEKNNNVSEIKVSKSSVLTDKEKSANQISQINASANLLSGNKIGEILSVLKQVRNTIEEQKTETKYLDKLMSNKKIVSEQVKSAINNFITYGVDTNTQKLGAGERAAVISSYKEAFNKLPETETELADAIKIANGRFPSVINAEAEKYAKEQFVKIYRRSPDLNNNKDNAAIKIIAYGLKQKAENRNLNSESIGIKTFKNIFGKVPQTTQDWNIMQAITYSGATR